MKAVVIFLAGMIFGSALLLLFYSRYEITVINGYPLRFDRLRGYLESPFESGENQFTHNE